MKANEPRSSRGLGRRPLTAVTRVQIPYGVQDKEESQVFGPGFPLFLPAAVIPWIIVPMNPDFMARAIDLSRQGMLAGDGGPFGAVVVRDGRILAEGHNTVVATNDPTNHAEMTAIRRAVRELGRFDLSDCELYANCEPCPMCLGAVYWARLGKVYFANTRDDAAEIGFDDSLIYGELDKPVDQRRIEFARTPDPRAREVFDEWFDKADRVQY